MTFEAWFRSFATRGPRNLRERWLWLLLLPAAYLFGWVAMMRVWAYRCGIFSSYRAPVPVVSIGNLAVGGTGKTPTVDWILHYLHQQGRRVAVVSRGYGGNLRQGVGVVADGSGAPPLLTARICGDEPYLLAQRHPQAVVVVARRRCAGVLLAVREFGAELVLLDDGFQHHAVARDLDVVLLDAQRPFGNGAPLPAGVLREFPRALQRGDLFILTRSRGVTPPLPLLPGPLLHCGYHLAARWRALSGATIESASLDGKRVIAFAGVAEPESFFAALRARGLNLVATRAFPDHSCYDPQLLAQLTELAAASAADFFVTTEKDGVKLADTTLSLPCFQAPLELVFNRAERLTDVLDTLLRKES